MFLFSLTPRRNKLTIIFLWNKSMFFLLESSLSLSQTSVKPRILQQNSLKILEKSSLFTVFPCSSLIFHVFSLKSTSYWVNSPLSLPTTPCSTLNHAMTPRSLSSVRHARPALAVLAALALAALPAFAGETETKVVIDHP